jgi:hypothetical protein
VWKLTVVRGRFTPPVAETKKQEKTDATISFILNWAGGMKNSPSLIDCEGVTIEK